MIKHSSKPGFTIVELLIVIVVIGILAAITIVAYNGIQQRGRDAKRVSDVATIDRYIKQYIVDNGASPANACGYWNSASNYVNNECESIHRLPNIGTYISGGNLPRDPINTATYSYVYAKGTTKNGSTYGGSSSPTSYVILARLEASSESLQALTGWTAQPTNPNYQFNYGVGGE